MKPPFLSSVIPQDTIKVGEEAKIMIQGNWPTPSWKHGRTDIEFNTEEKEVKIAYLGKSGGGMAMQVLKPFNDEIMVEFSEPGTWKLVFKNRGDDLELVVVVI